MEMVVAVEVTTDESILSYRLGREVSTGQKSSVVRHERAVKISHG